MTNTRITGYVETVYFGAYGDRRYVICHDVNGVTAELSIKQAQSVRDGLNQAIKQAKKDKKESK